MAAGIAEYRIVVLEAKRRLSDADLRFDEDTVVEMRTACLGALDQPAFPELTLSDYGISESDDEEVATAFWEEIKALEDSIDECGLKVRLADWQRTRTKAAVKMFKSLNRRSCAMQLWDSYAIPLRFREGRVVAIRAPRDVTGAPIIRSYAPRFFVAQMALASARQQEATLRAERRLKIASTLALALGFACVLLIAALLR